MCLPTAVWCRNVEIVFFIKLMIFFGKGEALGQGSPHRVALKGYWETRTRAV